MILDKFFLKYEESVKLTIPQEKLPSKSSALVLTKIIFDKIYGSLDKRGVFNEEQKGCKKGTLGTNDLILIDKMVLKEAKRRRKI